MRPADTNDEPPEPIEPDLDESTLWRASRNDRLIREQASLSTGATVDCAGPPWQGSLLVVEIGAVVLGLYRGSTSP